MNGERVVIREFDEASVRADAGTAEDSDSADSALRPRRVIALTLEYDGTLYCGWQSQKNASAIQDAVCEAIAKLDKNALSKVVGASRTDAGVHSRGQTASFLTESRIPADKYAFALNASLPRGISCAGSWEAEPNFHARHSALGKTYSYRILNRAFPSALERDRAWHVPGNLDIEVMKSAARHMTGERDFRAFMAAGSPVKSTIRNVWSIEITVEPSAVRADAREVTIRNETGRVITVVISGGGFLYNMARIMTGTLVYAGQGKIAANDIPGILSSKDRARAGKTAPPQGLCLERVYY